MHTAASVARSLLNARWGQVIRATDLPWAGDDDLLGGGVPVKRLAEFTLRLDGADFACDNTLNGLALAGTGARRTYRILVVMPPLREHYSGVVASNARGRHHGETNECDGKAHRRVVCRFGGPERLRNDVR